MHENIIVKKKKKSYRFSKAKVGITIFNKNGKIESNKIINLSSFLKKQPLTL